MKGPKIEKWAVLIPKLDDFKLVGPKAGQYHMKMDDFLGPSTFDLTPFLAEVYQPIELKRNPFQELHQCPSFQGSLQLQIH